MFKVSACQTVCPVLRGGRDGDILWPGRGSLRLPGSCCKLSSNGVTVPRYAGLLHQNKIFMRLNKVWTLPEAINLKVVRVLISPMCWIFSVSRLKSHNFATFVCQKSLPNMVRSPYTSRLRGDAKVAMDASSEMIQGSRDHDSFIMDLDPVEENDEL